MLKQLLLIVGLLFLSYADAQDKDSRVQVAQAFALGKTDVIYRHFPKAIDLDICGESNVYSHRQAKMILDDFFRKHPVDEFNMVNGKSRNAAFESVMATMRSGDRHFRLGYRVQKQGESIELRSIRISEIH